MQQVRGLAQRNAQVGTAVAGEQARPRADVGARQLQVAAALAGTLTVPAAADPAAVAVPLQLRFGEVGDEVVLVPVGDFEVPAAAMATLLWIDGMFDEDRTGGRLGSDTAGMLAVLLAAAVAARRLRAAAVPAGTLAALPDLLKFVLQPPPQCGVVRLQFGVALPKPLQFVHDPADLHRQMQNGKRREPFASANRPQLCLQGTRPWT